MKKQNKNEVILGVATHLDKHVGVLIDGFGKYLGSLSIETNPIVDPIFVSSQ